MADPRIFPAFAVKFESFKRNVEVCLLDEAELQGSERAEIIQVVHLSFWDAPCIQLLGDFTDVDLRCVSRLIWMERSFYGRFPTDCRTISYFSLEKWLDFGVQSNLPVSHAIATAVIALP